MRARRVNHRFDCNDQLLRRLAGESGCSRQATFEELLGLNEPLVMTAAQKYALWFQVDLEDMLQEGRIALLKAIKEYNPDLGVRFSTYANKCINNHLGLVAPNQGRGRAFCLPDHLTEYSKYFHSLGKIASDRGLCLDDLSDAELAAMTSEMSEYIQRVLTPKMIARLRRILPNITAISIEAPLTSRHSNHRYRLSDVLPAEGSLYEDVLSSIRQTAIRQVVEQLSDEDQRLIEQRFWRDEPVTHQEIGGSRGLSCQVVYNRQRRAKEKIRTLCHHNPALTDLFD